MNPEKSEPSDPEQELLHHHIDQLAEHFDTVQVFVSRHDLNTLDGTMSLSLGSGNMLARVGQVSEWLTINDERLRLMVRQQQQP